MGITTVRHIFCLFLILLCLQFVNSGGYGQNVEVKKSGKIIIHEGKKYFLHKVEKGQTLYSICNVYEIQKNDLILENPELINGVKEGMELRVPVKEVSKTSSVNLTPSPNDVKFKEHIVEPKQTLYAVSKLYSVSIDEILKYNPEAESGLKSGQTLRIPQKITPPPLYQKPEKKTEKPIEEVAPSLKKFNPTEAESSKTLISPVSSDSLKSLIKVAILLPFHLAQQKLDTDSSISFEPFTKSILAIEFYQGLLLAADSLTKKGLNFEFYTFDTANDSLELASVLSRPELKNVDLIIGPVYNERLMQASAFSKKHQIPMVSPFSPNNKLLLGNPFAAKVVAGSVTQFEIICNYISQTKKQEHIYLLTDESNKDAPQVNAVKRFFKNSKDSLHILSVKKGFGELEKILGDGKSKILIAPISDQPKVTELLGKIYLSKDTNLTIYGTDGWLSFNNIETERMSKMNVILPSYNYVDYSRTEVVNFILKYKSEQNIEPSKYVFQGYDVGLFFLDLIFKGKRWFLQLDNFSFNGLQNNFTFFKTGEESGFENKSVHLLSFKKIAPTKIN